MVATRPYVDSSGLVKLVLVEQESAALHQFLADGQRPVTSRIATVEVRRAVARVVRLTSAHEALLGEIWARSVIVELHEQLAEAAARTGQRTLRSLDAIHLATAVSVQDEIDAFVTYDLRLAEAARSLGLSVVAPA